MPRREPGLFGADRDPNKRVLIFAGRNKVDNWGGSSDSEDSDYAPSEEDTDLSKLSDGEDTSCTDEEDTVMTQVTGSWASSRAKKSKGQPKQKVSLAKETRPSSRKVSRSKSSPLKKSKPTASISKVSKPSQRKGSSRTKKFKPNSPRTSESIQSNSSLPCLSPPEGQISSDCPSRSCQGYSTYDDDGAAISASKKSSGLLSCMEKRTNQQNADSTDISNVNGDRWGSFIPPEILTTIFKCVVSIEGSLPFLSRAARVCRLWGEVATHSALWQSVDFSYGWIKNNNKTLKWLCPNRLEATKDINLTQWQNLTIEGVEAIAGYCPKLERINVGRCPHFNARCLKILVDRCPNLAMIDLTRVAADAVSKTALVHLAETCGENLKELYVSENTLIGFHAVLEAIAENCHNLEILEICNAKFSSDYIALKIELLQQGCPKLRALRLTNSKFRAFYDPKRAEDSCGFPLLEDLSVAISVDGQNLGIGMDDEFLHRLLKTSTNLRLLDLRGSSHITTRGIQRLAVTNLERLYISQSSVAKYDGIELIMSKWQHSLKELDLSWNIYPGMSLDLAMKKLSGDASKSKLERLNLSGTSISCKRLQSIFLGCPNLKGLNLASCRGLPRGMKRDYSGEDFCTLKKNIEKIIEEEEDVPPIQQLL